MRTTIVVPSRLTVALPPNLAYAAGRLPVDCVEAGVDGDVVVVVADCSLLHTVVSRAEPAMRERRSSEARVMSVSISTRGTVSGDTSEDRA